MGERYCNNLSVYVNACRYALEEYRKGQEGYVRILAEIAAMSSEAASAPEGRQHSEL